MQPDPYPPQALLIGHVSKDLSPHGATLGGTVSFMGLTLHTLGCQVRVVTSASSDFALAPLAELDLVCVPSTETTTFENQYSSGCRQQTVYGQAHRLSSQHIPPAWCDNDLLVLGPIADELETDIAVHVKHKLLGITAQGWLRQVDPIGRVELSPWGGLKDRLPHHALVILSVEDLGGTLEPAAQIANWCRVLAVTSGADGARVYWGGRCDHLPAPAAEEVDPTGAGDIFAAVFFYRMMLGDDPPQAAIWANQIASISVTRPGLLGVPTPDDIRTIEVRER
jgi:sugar/nucleoside kinase (ribokinase family)